MNRYLPLVDELIEEGYLTSEPIIEAFRKTERIDFLPPTRQFLDGLNTPLPIGYGQTISQPLTVAFMLELLNPQPGNTVLEIGYGSGWQTAILARIITRRPKDIPPKEFNPKIYAYEISQNLAEFGKQNVKKNLTKKEYDIITFFDHDFSQSFATRAPYDRIIAGASFEKNPDSLIKSLKVGGTIVYPTHAKDIRKVTRKTKETYAEDIYPGFVFVPILSNPPEKNAKRSR